MSTEANVTTIAPRPPMLAGRSPLLPIYPTSFEECVKYARMFIVAGALKPLTKGYGQDKEEESQGAMEARGTMIVMQGLEIGIPPVQAIQLLAMINGRITAHSEAVPGILLKHGVKIKKEFTGKIGDDDYTSICTLTRPDGQVFVSPFSIADAKRARLWSPEPMIEKTWYEKGGVQRSKLVPNDSPWHRFFPRMLWARALGFGAKDGAADYMRGLAVEEEILDMMRTRSMIDVTPNAPQAQRVAHSPAAAMAAVQDIPDVVPTPEPAAAQAQPEHDAGPSAASLVFDDIPDTPATQASDTADETRRARDAIKAAGNVRMLQVIRDSYPDADWGMLEADYLARRAQMAVTPQRGGK